MSLASFRIPKSTKFFPIFIILSSDTYRGVLFSPKKYELPLIKELVSLVTSISFEKTFSFSMLFLGFSIAFFQPFAVSFKYLFKIGLLLS